MSIRQQSQYLHQTFNSTHFSFFLGQIFFLEGILTFSSTVQTGHDDSDDDK